MKLFLEDIKVKVDQKYKEIDDNIDKIMEKTTDTLFVVGMILAIPVFVQFIIAFFF